MMRFLFRRPEYHVRPILALISLLAVFILVLAQTASAANSIERVADTDGLGFNATALALDDAGLPVVAFYFSQHRHLYVARCDDPACAGTDQLHLVDFAGDVGDFPALTLDANGYPVISYYRQGFASLTGDLMLAHCNDLYCDGGDGLDESRVIVDPEIGDNAGLWSSIQLDANGFPVISYHDEARGALKVAHCNDAICIGNNESLQIIQDSGFNGQMTSLALDAKGFPVISHYDAQNGDLQVVHCNDANCAGNDESIQTVDSLGNVGAYTSLALDANGFPVISYHSFTSGNLKLAHCNDSNCVGNDESIQTVDNNPNDVGKFSSLELDASGLPVISYYNASLGQLKLARCSDPNCEGGDESLQMVDEIDGRLTSLALDEDGFPVISYSREGDLYLAHCDTLDCHLAHTLRAQATGAGRGRMISGGINCTYDAGTMGDCTEQIADGSSVAVVAIPEQDSVFGAWTGCASLSTTTVPNDTCNVTITADTTISASFHPQPTLTVQGAGVASGSMNGQGIACEYVSGVSSGDCFETAVSGTIFSILAQADGQFNGWTGCDFTSTTNAPDDTCHVTLTGNRTISASFAVASEATAMHISELTPAATVNAANWNPLAIVQVLDDLQTPVSNATVTGTWQIGSSQQTHSCVTGFDGRCTITTIKEIALSIFSVTFNVIEITSTSLTYDPAANIITNVTVDQTAFPPPEN